MKKLKFTYILLQNIMAFPALLVHELSHYLMSLLLGIIPDRMEFDFYSMKRPMTGWVYFNERYGLTAAGSFRFFLISLAPFISVAATVTLMQFYTFFEYFFYYQLLFFRWSFPSNVDVNNMAVFVGYNRIIRWRWLEKITNWLYYDGLSSEEYFVKCEEIFLSDNR